MKRIRIAVLGLALVALGATTSEAQQQQGGPGRGGMNPSQRIARLLEGATVDAATQAKIDSVIKVHEPAMTKLREEMMAARQGGGDVQALMGKSRELGTKMNDDIKKVLTPDQVKVFEKNVEEQRNRQGGGRPPAR